MKIGIFYAVFLAALISFNKRANSQNLAWVKQIAGTSGSVIGHSITIDASGNIYTVGGFGYVTDFDPGLGTYNLTADAQDIFISKLNALGNFLWAKQIGGTGAQVANSVAVDAVGNVYVTGSFFDGADFDPGPGTYFMSSPGNMDVFILKLNSSGNFLWAKQLGGAAEDNGYSIAVDADGNVYTTGDFEDTADFDPGPGIYNMISAYNPFIYYRRDIFVSKLDSSGNFLWAKKMGGMEEDIAYSIVVDDSGNAFTTGSFRDSADFDPGTGVHHLVSIDQDNIFISKLDSSGHFVWVKQMGDTLTNCYGNAIVLDSNRNIYIAGYFYGSGDFDPDTSVYTLTTAGISDIFIAKLNSSGSFIWAKTMGGTNEDEALSMAVDASGNIFTTGKFKGTSDFDPGIGTYNLSNFDLYGWDVFVSKLDSSGNFVWAIRVGSLDYDIGNSIALNANGSVFAMGSFLTTVDFDPGPGTYNLSAGLSEDMYIMKLTNNPTGIDDIEGSNYLVSTYPNPTTDGQFTIACSESIDDLKIINPLGQVIYQAQPKTKNVSLRAKEPGIYFIKLTSNGKEITKKFIVQR